MIAAYEYDKILVHEIGYECFQFFGLFTVIKEIPKNNEFVGLLICKEADLIQSGNQSCVEAMDI